MLPLNAKFPELVNSPDPAKVPLLTIKFPVLVNWLEPENVPPFTVSVPVFVEVLVTENVCPAATVSDPLFVKFVTVNGELNSVPSLMKCR